MSSSVLQIKRMIPLLAAFVLSAGCTVYSGKIESDYPSDLVNRKVTFSHSNFRIVRDHVEGVAACSHVIFIQYPNWLQNILSLELPYASGIALGNPDLRERAMADLHAKHDLLGKAQQFNNIVEEWSVSNFLGLYAEVSLKITAEVVEFDTDSRKRQGTLQE